VSLASRGCDANLFPRGFARPFPTGGAAPLEGKT
jgi:hypothetical protein